MAVHERTLDEENDVFLWVQFSLEWDERFFSEARYLLGGDEQEGYYEAQFLLRK